MRLPRTLRTASFRLAALYLLLFTTSALVLGAVVFWTTSNALRQQMRAQVESESSLLQAEFRAAGQDGLRSAIVRRQRGVGALDYLLQDANGTRLVGDLPPIGSSIVNQTGWFTLVTREQSEEPEHVLALVARLPDGNVLAVGDDLGRLASAEEAIVTALIWAVALMALLGIGGGVLLSQAFLHRVDAISRTAEAIIGGDLNKRIPLRGTGDDLDHLASTLNRMLDRIGSLMESLRQVSSDIAHDLRTPLSRLLQRLDTARSNAQSIDDHALAIDAAAAEAEAILETFAALLRIAQVEGGAEHSNFHAVALSAIAETVVEAFAPSAEEQGHMLTGKVATELMIWGDRELLTQLLVNLVENALRHTPSGTPVVVSLARNSLGLPCLSVEDRGPGVPAAEHSLIFRRFYRSEPSRTTPGNGLGLSLVAAIARLHDADITLEDARPGLRVVVTFETDTTGLGNPNL